MIAEQCEPTFHINNLLGRHPLDHSQRLGLFPFIKTISTLTSIIKTRNLQSSQLTLVYIHSIMSTTLICLQELKDKLYNICTNMYFKLYWLGTIMCRPWIQTNLNFSVATPVLYTVTAPTFEKLHLHWEVLLLDIFLFEVEVWMALEKKHTFYETSSPNVIPTKMISAFRIIRQRQ